MKLQHVVVAAAALASSSAEAAVVTYNFTADASLPGAEVTFQRNVQTCRGAQGCDYEAGDPQFNNFVMSATFIRDTRNPGPVTLWNGLQYASAGEWGASPAVPTAVATATATGGLSATNLTVLGYSSQDVSVQPFPGGEFYIGNIDWGIPVTVETWGDGTVKRTKADISYVDVQGYGADDFVRIDGFDWPQTLSMSGAMSILRFSMLEIVVDYDEQGTYLQQAVTQWNWGGQITAMNFSVEAVPEPGMLALFGMGVLGLGIRWRRHT